MPWNLPVDEWAYSVVTRDQAAGETPIFQPDPASVGWRVTKIQFFNGSIEAGLVSVGGATIPVGAGGCMCLSPDGYLPPMATVACHGEGSRIVIEYIYKANEAGTSPNILITV